MKLFLLDRHSRPSVFLAKTIGLPCQDPRSSLPSPGVASSSCYSQLLFPTSLLSYFILLSSSCYSHLLVPASLFSCFVAYCCLQVVYDSFFSFMSVFVSSNVLFIDVRRDITAFNVGSVSAPVASFLGTADGLVSLWFALFSLVCFTLSVFDGFTSLPVLRAMHL